ncbi:MAG: helix-turn-helix transcriptional regulator [Akkermansiaceae bacterium]
MANDSPTRTRLLDLLKQHGPQEAQVLSEKLAITAMAVRQHLYQLRDEKLITHLLESRTIGRPAKLWQLTDEANRLFPDAHAALAVDLVSSLTTTFGKAGLDQLISVRAKEQIVQYSEQMPRASTLRQKLDKLAELRTNEGYMAEVSESEDGTLMFIENHCPICAAASVCSGLCAAELNVFSAVIGKDFVIERTEYILENARRCAYEIKKKKL